MLSRFLREAGYQNIQLQAHDVDFSTATEAQEEFFQNMQAGLKLLQPFLVSQMNWKVKNDTIDYY
jgi:hypothetical protein